MGVSKHTKRRWQEHLPPPSLREFGNLFCGSDFAERSGSFRCIRLFIKEFEHGIQCIIQVFSGKQFGNQHGKGAAPAVIPIGGPWVMAENLQPYSYTCPGSRNKSAGAIRMTVPQPLLLFPALSLSLLCFSAQMQPSSSGKYEQEKGY